MQIVILRFSDNRQQAGEFMAGHNAWLKQGFDDGVFLVAGSIQPGKGGCIVAHGTSAADLTDRVNEDPFVSQNVVSAEILDISPAKADDRLTFLLEQD